MKHRHGKLYIRLYKEGDRSTSMREAYRVAGLLQIAEFRGNPGKVYVAVQHGEFPPNVQVSGFSKQEIKERFLGNRTWPETQRFFKHSHRRKTPRHRKHRKA